MQYQKRLFRNWTEDAARICVVNVVLEVWHLARQLIRTHGVHTFFARQMISTLCVFCIADAGTCQPDSCPGVANYLDCSSVMNCPELES